MNWNLVMLALGLLELAGLLWIALMERASLEVDRANHRMYSSFFAERTRWYAARGKNKKPPEELPGGGDTDFVVLLAGEEDSDRREDGLREVDGGVERLPARSDPPSEERG
jgi:hypothetical protein